MTEKFAQLLRMKNELKEIFYAALNSVKPNVLIQNKIRVCDNHLLVDDNSYVLSDKVYLIGFGKAVMGMAIEMDKLLGRRLIEGIISIPRGSMSQQLRLVSNFSASELDKSVSYRESGADNQADEDTLKITQEIMNLAESLDRKDTLIVLISGGGSALLSMPPPPMTLKEKNEFWKELQNSGADIREVNAVRQRLSMVKGGRLAELAYPAAVLSFILSDIIGDPVELIAGGPTCHISRDSSEVLRILEKYNIKDIDDRTRQLFSSSETCDVNHFKNVSNFIIGNNSCAIDAARVEALSRGFNVIVLFDDVEGLVKNVSEMYAHLTRLFCAVIDDSMTKGELKNSLRGCKYLRKLDRNFDIIFANLRARNNRGLLLIGGGEPAVIVRGAGKGGRNQELALQFSLDWSQQVSRSPRLSEFDVLFLSAGTDGQDGPTDAAGAFGYADTPNDEKRKEYLMNNDSYHFYTNFGDGGDLLKTGFTSTNVMDLHFIYIHRPSRLN